MQKKITKLVFIFSIFFSVQSTFALEIIDLATLDQEKIEGSVEDSFGMQDYEAMLEEDMSGDPIEEPLYAGEEEAGLADVYIPDTSAVEAPSDESLPMEAPLVIQQEETTTTLASSAPLAQSGPGVVIGLGLALLGGLFFFPKKNFV